jgi:hypothetical protein
MQCFLCSLTVAKLRSLHGRRSLRRAGGASQRHRSRARLASGCGCFGWAFLVCVCVCSRLELDQAAHVVTHLRWRLDRLADQLASAGSRSDHGRRLGRKREHPSAGRYRAADQRPVADQRHAVRRQAAEARHGGTADRVCAGTPLQPGVCGRVDVGRCNGAGACMHVSPVWFFDAGLFGLKFASLALENAGPSGGLRAPVCHPASQVAADRQGFRRPDRLL